MANENDWSTQIRIIQNSDESQEKKKWAEEQLEKKIKQHMKEPQMDKLAYYRGCLDMLLVLNGELDIADMNQPFED